MCLYQRACCIAYHSPHTVEEEFVVLLVQGTHSKLS